MKHWKCIIGWHDLVTVEWIDRDILKWKIDTPDVDDHPEKGSRIDPLRKQVCLLCNKTWDSITPYAEKYKAQKALQECRKKQAELIFSKHS